MEKRGFQQTHMVADQDHRLAGDIAQIFQTGQVDPAAALLDQAEVFVGVINLPLFVEPPAPAAASGPCKYAEVVQIKVPAAAERQTVKHGLPHTFRRIISVAGEKILTVFH